MGSRDGEKQGGWVGSKDGRWGTGMVGGEHGWYSWPVGRVD